MGDYALSDFTDRLKLELGQRTDLESPTDWYDKWINTAYMTLATKKRYFDGRRYHTIYFPELEVVDTSQSTTDGTAYLTTPTDCLHIRKIFDETNNVKLTAISVDEYLSYTDRDTAASEGKPTEYVRMAEAATSGSRIYLHPTPDDEYSLYIYYRKRPAELDDDTDTTLLGDEWDEPILKLAVIQAQMRLKEYDKAKLEKEEWRSMMNELVGVYDGEKLDRDEIRKPSATYGARRTYRR